jgi:hypothetical protein
MRGATMKRYIIKCGEFTAICYNKESSVEWAKLIVEKGGVPKITIEECDDNTPKKERAYTHGTMREIKR